MKIKNQYQIEKEQKFRKIAIYVAIFFFACCSIIGIYGIITAPSSDQEQLKKELQQKEQSLQKNATSSAILQATPDKSDESEKSISVIGDSVFLGASLSFQKLQKNAVIDAKVSRQVYHGIDVAKKLKQKQKLGNLVIISLGTNSKFNPATGQELIDYLGKEREIYWINVYGKKLEFQDEVNETIHSLVEKNDNVHLIPWSEEGKKHPDWFYQDGTHLNTKGQDGFADYINSFVPESK